LEPFSLPGTSNQLYPLRSSPLFRPVCLGSALCSCRNHNPGTEQGSCGVAILPTKNTLTDSQFLSGTGYIGSFTSLTLLEHGYDVVIVDSLYNSSEVALDRIELICGRRPAFYKLDITDEKAIDEVFAKHPAIDSVIHFAALKASRISIAFIVYN
jgi:hypothetical protein